MKQIIGNLLDVTSGTVLHQVNCKGATGGLAGVLRTKWPKAFDSYFETVRDSRTMRHGDVAILGGFTHGSQDGVTIGHVFGQYQPGPHTDMHEVRRSLRSASREVGGAVYAPWHMGCGLGGGNWAVYLEALVNAFPEIIIMQRYEDAN